MVQMHKIQNFTIKYTILIDLLIHKNVGSNFNLSELPNLKHFIAKISTFSTYYEINRSVACALDLQPSRPIPLKYFTS